MDALLRNQLTRRHPQSPRSGLIITHAPSPESSSYHHFLDTPLFASHGAPIMLPHASRPSSILQPAQSATTVRRIRRGPAIRLRPPAPPGERLQGGILLSFSGQASECGLDDRA